MRARVALSLLVLVAGACAPGAGDDSGGEGAIRFQVAGDAEETVVYERLVTAFEAEHPDIDVQLIPIASKDEHIQKLNTSFAQNDPPETFLVNFREFSQYVARGAIQPLGPLLEEAGIDPADYFPQPIEAFTYDGRLQCMPQNISSLVVYYNTALFEDAGIPRPSPEWTLGDFREIALQLTTGDVDGAGIEPSVIRLAPFVWSSGGEVVDNVEQPTRFTLREPAARGALEFLVRLAREDGVVPTEREIAAQDLETRFATGKLAMFLSSRRDTPVFREAIDLEWDVLPLPVGIEPASILHSDAYCLSSGVEDVDDVLEFIRFAVGPDGQTITALGGRTVPSLESVARSGAFLDPTQPPEHAQVFLDAIPFLRRTPVIPTWPEIEDAAAEILTRAFYEPSYSIDQTLDDLDAATIPLFEEAGTP